jgi:hypothetical protein
MRKGIGQEHGGRGRSRAHWRKKALIERTGGESGHTAVNVEKGRCKSHLLSSTLSLLNWHSSFRSQL